MANRIIRGFSRLGVGAAVLVAMCGAGFTAVAIVMPALDPYPPPDLAAYAIKTAGIGLGITSLLALAAFVFFRGLGWVITGFARD
jgi:hypothetical protein